MWRVRSLVTVTAVASTLISVAGWRAAPVIAQSSGAPDLAAIRAIVEAPITSGKVAGASVVVARQGQTILSESFGKADLELDVPMPADASFEIGSVTKQFTAAAILLLVERGKLGLDDELTKYLPDYPTNDQRITIRHLLTHTSGIKGYTELPEFGDLMPLRKSPRHARQAVLRQTAGLRARRATGLQQLGVISCSASSSRRSAASRTPTSSRPTCSTRSGCPGRTTAASARFIVITRTATTRSPTRSC